MKGLKTAFVGRVGCIGSTRVREASFVKDGCKLIALYMIYYDVNKADYSERKLRFVSAHEYEQLHQEYEYNNMTLNMKILELAGGGETKRGMYGEILGDGLKTLSEAMKDAKEALSAQN